MKTPESLAPTPNPKPSVPQHLRALAPPRPSHATHILLASLFLLASTPLAFAHAQLDHADPKVGSTITTPPTQVKITFDQDIQPAHSDIQVFDPAGNQLDNKDSHPDPNDPSILIVSLPPLPPATYTVRWHALCLFNHKTQGTFQFTLAPKPAP